MMLDQKALEAVGEEVEVDRGWVAHWVVPGKHAQSHRGSWSGLEVCRLTTGPLAHHASPVPKVNPLFNMMAATISQSCSVWVDDLSK